jgi:hypothetical protein
VLEADNVTFQEETYIQGKGIRLKKRAGKK